MHFGSWNTADTLTSGANYRYRADGMRVVKTEGLLLGLITVETTDEGDIPIGSQQATVSGYYDITSSNWPTTRYYYDGQMPLGDDFTRKGSNNHDLIDQNWVGIGARGMDYQSSRTWDATSSSWVTSLAESFPLYDCHGNNCLSLSRSGSSGYSLSSERTYDAWGAVTGGNSPNHGYCANLGHRADDESSLVYMRARYYEPSTGRFVSEDPAADGNNWYTYCGSDPVNYWDETEKDRTTRILAGVFELGALGALFAGFVLLFQQKYSAGTKAIRASLTMTMIAYAFACTSDPWQSGVVGIISYLIEKLIPRQWGEGVAAGSRTLAVTAVLAIAAYTLILCVFTLQLAIDES